MALSASQLANLQRPVADQDASRMRQLYRRLYPLILQDFAHRQDIAAALLVVEQELSLLNTAVVAHTHASIGSPGLYPGAHAVQVPLQSGFGSALVRSALGEAFEVRIDYDDIGAERPFSAV